MTIADIPHQPAEPLAELETLRARAKALEGALSELQGYATTELARDRRWGVEHRSSLEYVRDICADAFDK